MGTEYTVNDASSPPPKRPHWRGKWSFLYATMSYAIGLGVLWRFPRLMAANGGIIFLIPYITMVLILGLPLWLLEAGLGQIHQTSGLTVWRRIRPYFTGIGYASTLMAFILNSYYIVVLAWILHYFASSFTSGALPWGRCDNAWNTADCYTPSLNDSSARNGTSDWANGTTLSAKEFLERNVLQVHVSSGVNEPAGLQPLLVLTLLLSWMIVFFSLFRGMRSLSVSVLLTALLPYGLLGLLLLRGITLPGATTGLAYYLAPDFGVLFQFSTWFDASTQVLFSYGLSLGALTTLGSYNTPKSNLYHHLWTASAIHTLMALCAGATVFTYVGYLAEITGRPIDAFSLGGQKLAFITLAQAFAALPLGQLWALLFFSLMFTLGLGSQFLTVEAALRAVLDRVPKLGQFKVWLLGGICLGSFIIGLSMVTRGGNYVFQIFDLYGASSLVILLIVIAETLVVGYVYGVEQFEGDLADCLGFPISPVYRVYWKYLIPPVLAYHFLFNVYQFSNAGGEPVFPRWSLALGWMALLGTGLALPVGLLRYWFPARDQKPQATTGSALVQA